MWTECLLLLLLSAGCSCSRGPIQRVLHRVYLDGQDAFESQTAYPKGWFEWCEALHPHWQHMFWDQAAADKLVATDFPWFESTWKSYQHRVERGDALRPMILYKYGGLYLDMDMQCLQPNDAFLAGHDLVVQGSDYWHESVHQAALAAKKHEPILLKMLEVMIERQAEDPPLYDLNSQTSVYYRTGPYVVRDVLGATLGVSRLIPDEVTDVEDSSQTYKFNGSSIQIYDNTHWFPLIWGPSQKLSREAHIEQLQTGQLPLVYAGFHHGKGDWMAEQLAGASS